MKPITIELPDSIYVDDKEYEVTIDVTGVLSQENGDDLTESMLIDNLVITSVTSYVNDGKLTYTAESIPLYTYVVAHRKDLEPKLYHKIALAVVDDNDTVEYILTVLEEHFEYMDECYKEREDM